MHFDFDVSDLSLRQCCILQRKANFFDTWSRKDFLALLQSHLASRNTDPTAQVSKNTKDFLQIRGR